MTRRPTAHIPFLIAALAVAVGGCATGRPSLLADSGPGRAEAPPADESGGPPDPSPIGQDRPAPGPVVPAGPAALYPPPSAPPRLVPVLAVSGNVVLPLFDVRVAGLSLPVPPTSLVPGLGLDPAMPAAAAGLQTGGAAGPLTAEMQLEAGTRGAAFDVGVGATGASPVASVAVGASGSAGRSARPGAALAGPIGGPLQIGADVLGPVVGAHVAVNPLTSSAPLVTVDLDGAVGGAGRGLLEPRRGLADGPASVLAGVRPPIAPGG